MAKAKEEKKKTKKEGTKKEGTKKEGTKKEETEKKKKPKKAEDPEKLVKKEKKEKAKKEREAKKEKEKEEKKKGKRKGMSAEEKSKVILSIYYKMRTVLNLKEIEKFASKAGVVLQTIKDINQQLVYDNYVCSDKIGSSTYFWAFPSQGFNVRRKMIEELEKKKEQTKKEMENSISQINKGLKDREDPNNQREGKSKKLEELRKILAVKRDKVSVYLRCDDSKIEEMRTMICVSREACNRWNDNLYVIKEWMIAAKPDLTMREIMVNFPAIRNVCFKV